MVDDAAEVAAVRSFVVAVRRIRTLLFEDLAPVSSVPDLLTSVRSRRELAREGVSRSGIQYVVHGVGCRMTAPDGDEVDIDLVADPVTGEVVEAFDSWRVRWFLDEAADDGFSNEQIEAACDQLVRAGTLRAVSKGWYALAEERAYDGPAPVSS